MKRNIVFAQLASVFVLLAAAAGNNAFGQSAVVASQPAKERSTSTILNRLITVKVDAAPLANVLETISKESHIRFQYYPEVVGQAKKRVTLHVTQVPLSTVLSQVLDGTRLDARPMRDGSVVIASSAGKSLRGTVEGTIAGRVIDAKTKLPLRGAGVTVDDLAQRVISGPNGEFLLVNIASGEHTIRVRSVGYFKKATTVTVTDGTTTPVEVTLEPSVNALDQVVVTGTVIPTELKAVPNAISIITAKDIEQRGITHIDQLFRGDIPGLFAQNQGANTALDEVTMFSRGATALSRFSAGVTDIGSTAYITNPIKTYVDGVELADSKYLSQIDPKSIERIEILAGPQASTIYGSNAINGVMQIFTKRGLSAKPQLTLNLLSGWVENSFNGARAPQHDYSAQLNGVEGRVSYNAGGSWNYVGPWTPSKQTARTSGFGGARLEGQTRLGRVVTDFTLRRSITQNQANGDVYQTTNRYQETGWYDRQAASGSFAPITAILHGQTLGVTVSYTPVPWWTQELGWGDDASDAESRYTAPAYLNVSDTALQFQQNHTDRRSIRSTTTVRFPMTHLSQATLTIGGDAWQNSTSSTFMMPQALVGTLTGAATVLRQPGHNSGAFLQTQVAVRDQLFLTFGVRAEWNPGFGKEAEPSYAPRYGIAYSQDFGPVTAKLRGSYGRSTRPPQATFKVKKTVGEWFGPFMLSFYPNVDYYLANPELTPEYQQGGEGGLELYFGAHGSLVVTRYNQTVSKLISSVTGVDSVDLLPAARQQFGCADWECPLYQNQYLNVGDIRNQGWELQGSANAGPLTTHGTYSWTKSRTIGITPKYRMLLQNQPQYEPGASFQFLPEHTWAFGITYARSATRVGINVTGVGRVTNLFDDVYLGSLSYTIRLPQNRANMNPAGYSSSNSRYALTDLVVSYRVVSSLEGVLQVQNLTNHYVNDFSATVATMGRQSKLGVRVRY